MRHLIRPSIHPSIHVGQPRIPPLQDGDFSDEQRELLTRGNPAQILNVFRTLATHTDLYKRWMPFANHVQLER